MSTELKQAAQDAAEAIDWLLKNIRLDAPQLSGKAMGNAEKCASALRTAIQQAEAKVNEPVWFHKHWGKDDDIFYRPNDVIPDGSTPLYTAAPGVSNGYAMVPIEPTAEMLQAALKVATPGALRAAWARMLAAAEIGKAMP